MKLREAQYLFRLHACQNTSTASCPSLGGCWAKLGPESLLTVPQLGFLELHETSEAALGHQLPHPTGFLPTRCRTQAAMTASLFYQSSLLLALLILSGIYFNAQTE